MSKKKNSQDLLLRQAGERAPRYSLLTRVLQCVMLPIALISDFVCYIAATSYVFNEGPSQYLPVAVVGTLALDVTMAVAGEISSRLTPSGKTSSRLRFQVAGLVGIFFAAYVAYLFLLSQQLAALSTLPFIGRMMTPAITSGCCFFVCYQANPAEQRAALLERQMLELQDAINQVSAEVERGQETLAKFDPDQLDAIDFQHSMRQAELAELEARLKMRSMLLEVLPTQDAVTAFLMDPQLEADIAMQTGEIRDGNHPMPIPQAHGTPDQHESVVFPA